MQDSRSQRRAPLAVEVRRQERDLRLRERAASRKEEEEEEEEGPAKPARRGGRTAKAKEVEVVETRADVTIGGRVGARAEGAHHRAAPDSEHEHHATSCMAMAGKCGCRGDAQTSPPAAGCGPWVAAGQAQKCCSEVGILLEGGASAARQAPLTCQGQGGRGGRET